MQKVAIGEIFEFKIDGAKYYVDEDHFIHEIDGCRVEWLIDDEWLNTEVEIIEEDKKIEYVGRTYDLTDFYKNYPEVAEMLRDLANKTIEIIDFINEGRDE